MIDRTRLAVLFGLLSLACGLQCPKQKISPGREVVCYTSILDAEQLTEAVCKCTTLVHKGHDVRNVSISEFEGFQKSLKGIIPTLQFVISVDDPGKTLRTSGTVRQEITARLIGVLKEVDGVELNMTAGSKERLQHFVKGLKDELVRKSYDKRIFLVLPTKSEDLAKQFDLKELTKYVDLFTIPTHYLVEDDEAYRAFHPSRLMGLFDMFNADSLIDLISGLGAPKRKILMSVPASAYRFTLKDQDDNAPRAPTEEIQPAIIDQKQLCEFMNKGEWTVERDEDLTAPYAFKDNMWIAFEDKISLSIKGKYVLLRDLPGMAIHDIENDFKTKCGKPLTHEIHHSFSDFKRKSRAAVLNALEDDLHQTELEYATKVKSSDFRVVRVVDTEGHIRAVRENTQTEFTCSRQGYFVHPKSCNRFYRCVKFNQEVEDYSVFEFDCPAGLSFDERTEVCVWPGSMPEGSPCPGSSEIAPVTRIRFECPTKSGYYADPQNPRWFFACIDLGGPDIMAYEFRCPFGLIFDEQKLICEWPWLVEGYSGSGYTRPEYNGYGTGSTPGTGGYYTGGLPHGFTGTEAGGVGYSGVGYSGHSTPFGHGTTGLPGVTSGGHGISYGGQGTGGYSGTTGSGYSGSGGAGGHGTSYGGQGTGGYSGTTGSGYSGSGGAGGHGAGGYSGSGGAAGHGTSYGGQGTGGYSGSGGAGGHGTSYGGQGTGGYSGTTGSGYSGSGGAGGHGTGGYSGSGGAGGHGTSYGGQGTGGYSGTTGSGYSGSGGTGGHGTGGYSGSGGAGSHGTSYGGQGTGGYSGSGGAGGHGTSYGGQGTGGYSGTTGSGYSGSGGAGGHGTGGYSGSGGAGDHGSSYGGQGTGGYSGSGGAGGHGTSYGGQGTGGYSGTTGSGYSGSAGHGGSTGYSGATGSGATGHGSYDHGTGYTQTTGSGYSGSGGSQTYSGATGTGQVSGTGYTGEGSIGHSGAGGIYSGTGGTGYTGSGSTVAPGHGYSGFPGSTSSQGGYSGTGGIHGGSTGTGGIHGGSTGGKYSGTGGIHGGSTVGYSGSSGIHGGSTAGGYAGSTGTGQGGVTGGYSGTGGVHGGSTGGYSGSGGIHGGATGGYAGSTGTGQGGVTGGYSGTGGVHGGSTGGYSGSGGIHGGSTGGYSGSGGIHGGSTGGYSGPGGIHGGSTGAGTGQGGATGGYSGTGGIHGGGYSGTTGSGHGGAPGGYSGTGGIHGGVTGTGGIHGGSTGTGTGQGGATGGYSGTGGIHGGGYSGTTGSGHGGAPGGYSGTGGIHGGVTGTGGIHGGSTGTSYAGSTAGVYTGAASGHAGTSGTSFSSAGGYTGGVAGGTQIIVTEDYGGVKGSGSPGTQYVGPSYGTKIPGSSGGVDYSGTGSTQGHGYPGQSGTSYGIHGGSSGPGQTVTFGTHPSQTPIYVNAGSTGIESTGVTSVYATPGPVLIEKPDKPTCVTTCIGSSLSPGAQAHIPGGVTSGPNIYQGTSVYVGGLNGTYGSHVPSFGSTTFGAVTPSSVYGVTSGPGAIITGHNIPGSIVTGDSTPGTVITYGGNSGTVLTGGSDQGSIVTGGSHPGYTKTAPGTPGYVISDGVKTVYPGSGSSGGIVYGTSSHGVVVTGSPDAGTVVKGQSSPGIILTGQTAPGVSIHGAIDQGTVTGPTGHHVITDSGYSPGITPGYGTKIGTVTSTYDTSYKTNEYHDNGGRGTIRFNNGDVTTKYTENDIPDYRPAGGTIPSNTFLTGSKGAPTASTPRGFIKTGPTLSTSGSYGISTGRPGSALHPENIGPNAFKGSVAGYTKSSTESSIYTSSYDQGVHVDTSKITISPSKEGYSYPTPNIPFETGVTKNLPISATEENVFGPTTPTPFLNVEVHNTPKISSPGGASTYQRPSGFTKAPTSGIPVGYTTGPLENYKTTVFEAAKIPVTISSVHPVLDTGYQTVISSTPVPVNIGPVKYGEIQTGSQFDFGTKQQGAYISNTTPSSIFGSTPKSVFEQNVTPSGSLKPQTQYQPITISPAVGVTYRKPFPLPDVTYQSTPKPYTIAPSGYSIESTTISGGSPTNVAIPRDQVDKLITNYNRGTTKYVPSQYDVYTPGSISGTDYSRTQTSGVSSYRQSYGSTTPSSIGRTQLSSTVATYGGGYSKPSQIITYQTTAKSTAVAKGKVIVKWSDLHPLLLGKLGAECTCRGDPFANLRGPGSKLISSSKGKVDLANYDESDIYVDLEKEDPYDDNDYVTNHESSSAKPVKIWNNQIPELLSSSSQTQEKPSSAYLPSVTPSVNLGVSAVGLSNRGFTANRRSAKSLHFDSSTQGSVITAANVDSSVDGADDVGETEETFEGEGTTCARPGLFRHPNFCNKFYACHWDEWKKKFTLHVFNCPVHLTFDNGAAACNWPSMGPACQDNNLLV